MTFNYITNLQDYQDAIASLSTQPYLAADTETYALPHLGSKGSALDPHLGRISLVILKGPETIPYVLDILHLEDQRADFTLLKDLLFGVEFSLWQNAKFDLKFLKSTFGWMPENVADTLIMSKLLGNACGSKSARMFGHSYADLCRDLLNVHITGKKDLRESTWYCSLDSRRLDNEWWLDKLTYAANDVEYLFPLYDILYNALTKPLPTSPLLGEGTNEGEAWGWDMKEVLEREFSYIPLIAAREYEGMTISVDAMKSIQAAINNRVIELGAKISVPLGLDEPQLNWRRQLTPSAKALKTLRSSQGLLKCIKSIVPLGNLDNVQSNVLSRILEILETLASSNVNEEAAADVFIDENEELLYGELKTIEHSEILNTCPLMQDILSFKRAVKQSGMNLLKFINPVTGKIHSSFDQLGTATGRLSCFVAGTLVAAPGGAVPIESIQVGDMVYCYLDGQVTTRPVLHTFLTPNQETVDILINDKIITCTKNHKFYLKDRTLRRADNLTYSDKLHLFHFHTVSDKLYGTKIFDDYDTLSITDICLDDVKQSSNIINDVYNIEVEEAHNYFVEGLNVKNCSRPNLQQVSNRIKVELDIDHDNFFDL